MTCPYRLGLNHPLGLCEYQGRSWRERVRRKWLINPPSRAYTHVQPSPVRTPLSCTKGRDAFLEEFFVTDFFSPSTHANSKARRYVIQYTAAHTHTHTYIYTHMRAHNELLQLKLGGCFFYFFFFYYSMQLSACRVWTFRRICSKGFFVLFFTPQNFDTLTPTTLTCQPRITYTRI